jgi:hypothetical protein
VDGFSCCIFELVQVEIKWEDILEKEREDDSDDEDDLHFDVDLDEHGDDAMRKEVGRRFLLSKM